MKSLHERTRVTESVPVALQLRSDDVRIELQPGSGPLGLKSASYL